MTVYGYLIDMATYEIWLPEDISYNQMPNSSAHLHRDIDSQRDMTAYSYLLDMATCEILLPTRYSL